MNSILQTLTIAKSKKQPKVYRKSPDTGPDALGKSIETNRKLVEDLTVVFVSI